MSRTRAVLTASVLLSTLALGGCSDDEPQPKFAPPSSEAPTSPSTTAATAGPVEPSFPAQAEGTNAASAEAFVKFYWQLVTYAQASGDLNALRRLAAPSCAACKAGVEYLEDVFKNDGRITGGVGTVRIRRSALVEADDEKNAVVKFILTTTPQRVDYPGTEADETYAGGRQVVNALLESSEGSWIMNSWGVQG